MKNELDLVWIRKFLETRPHELILLDSFFTEMALIQEPNRTSKLFSWTERANKGFGKI